MEKTNKQIKTPNVFESFSSIIVLIGLIIIAVRAEVSIIPMLALSAIWVALIGLKMGYKWSELYSSIIEKLSGLIDVMLIMLAIGTFIAAMMFSGTIPTLIYYLLKIVNPNFIIVLSFIITGVVALLIGTSWGTAGTVGVVMIALAHSTGVSIPMVAGAVISGSHVGQVLSPMSDMSNLAANLGKTDVMSMIKRVLYITTPVIIIMLVFYTFLGFNGGVDSSITSNLNISNEIKAVFNTNPLVLIPIILLFVLTFMKKPVLTSLIIASFIGVIVGVIANGYTFTNGINAIYSGFDFSTITGLNTGDYSDIFLNLVNRGGAKSVSSVLILTLTATSYAALIQKIGSVDVIVKTLFSKVKGRIGLAVSTVSISMLIDMCTSNSYLSVMMPKDFLEKKYSDAGLKTIDVVAISQCVGAIFMACIPWTDTAIYMAGVTGASTLASLPYNLFCWGPAVMAIIVSIIGFGYTTKKDA